MDIKTINNQKKTIKTKRKEIITLFNPPYSKSVKTNNGRLFINLISKRFPPNHKYVKVFNKNPMKLSYCCMPNIRSIVNGHNKKVLQPKPIEPQMLCNYLVKEDCLMNGLCLTSTSSYYKMQQ